MENSTALPSPPPTSSTVSFAGVSVGVPVGPIRITGSPGFSSAHRSDDPPISSTMVESNPCFAIDRRAGQRETFHGERGSVRSRGARVSKFCRR